MSTDYEGSHGVVLGSDDGISTGGNAAWDDAAAHTLLAGSTERIGYRFTTLPTTAVGSRGGVDLTQTANLYQTVTFTAAYLVSLASGVIAVYLVDELSPTAFSNARVPGGGVLTERLIHTSTLELGSGTFSLTLDMTVIGGGIDGAQNPYHGLGFDGSFALTVGWTSTGGVLSLGSEEFPTILPPGTLDLAGSPYHSGIAGIPPIGGAGRIDDRTGQFSDSDQLIVDGYSGASVLPENWDPPDDDPIFDPVPRRYDGEV